MIQIKRTLFVRNIDADFYLEGFLVSAISAIILIRSYLYLTGYPQIGGGGLHIAHMLWGGLMMAAAIFISLSFLTRPTMIIASLIGGLGFGIFIDELGKFITSDNNYFFQPTFALIYVIFILLYLLFRLVEKNDYSRTEYLINALETLKEALVNDLDGEEKKKALFYLSKITPPTTESLAFEKLVNSSQLIDTPHHDYLTKLNTFFRELYQALVQDNWFIKFLAFIFFMKIFLPLPPVLQIALTETYKLTFFSLGEIISAGLAALLAIYGLINLRRSRLQALRAFKYSLLISIFLTQFFVFYRLQLVALADLVINLLLLFTINYMLSRETKETII